jgi:CDP-diacylglycerol---serine O-phosphatidyltransferase
MTPESTHVEGNDVAEQRIETGRRAMDVLGNLRYGPRDQRLRRGVYLLPSLFTLGNMFCGYACILYAMRGDVVSAAPFVGFALVLDMLDGRIARLTNTTSAFGREFDSLADVVSFGVAPAILTFVWGLEPLRRLGWAVGFLYVTATAVRLARFNIQSGSATDRRFFVGMPCPAAAAVLASAVFFYPQGFHGAMGGGIAVAIVVIPAILMVTTIRFRSFKTVDLRARRPYTVLLLLALVFALIQLEPSVVLLMLAIVYLLSAFVEMAWTRLRRRPAGAPAEPHADGD